MTCLQRLLTSSQIQLPGPFTHTSGGLFCIFPLIFAETMRKKSRLTRDSHRTGSRARKDRHAFEMAKHRAAKTDALREEAGDMQEDVARFEYKCGEVGKTIRLQRVNPSSVSGDAAQPAPQNSLPVVTGNQQQGPQPGSVLDQFANLPDHERLKQSEQSIRDSHSTVNSTHISSVKLPGTSRTPTLCVVSHNVGPKSPPTDRRKALQRRSVKPSICP